MLSLLATASAIAPGLTASFAGSGGTEPYSYAVIPGGAGGTINSSTGLYQAASAMKTDPAKAYDTIRVTDADSNTKSLPILVADPLFLFCEIIQKELALMPGRVFLWDQKVMQPTDEKMFVAVSMLNCKPFANSVKLDSAGNAVQSVNMMATLSLNVISRSTEALLRKEEVLMALASQYSQSQQEANSFNVGKLPPAGQFVNLSNIDGAAIPYRFNISVNMQYFVRKTKAVPYFDDFEDVTVVTEP